MLGYLVALATLFAISTTMFAQTTTNSPPLGSLQNILQHVGADPAAGAEWTITVPANEIWRVKSVVATLVTAVAAANREVSLVTDDGTNTTSSQPTGLTHIASLTKIYTFLAQGGRTGTGTQALNQVTAMGDHWLRSGERIRSVTTNIQGADDWSAPRLVAERYR